MIIKGGSRAGPEQLARHLQRRDTNEYVEIIEMQWPGADLKETLRDWQTLSEATRGKKGLYHANIDPDADYAMSRDQWRRCVQVLEKELGFEGQPRTVVMHEKYGRQHIHVVWARTDVDTMKLCPDSQNYKAHERASKALEIEFGHEMVPGKHAKRDREKQPEFPRQQMNHAEWQQYERTGIHPDERKERISAMRQLSDNAQAFKAALESQGYILARGDRRDFVVVDEAGSVHSLGRQIPGMSATEFREFMKSIDRGALPSVKQVVADKKYALRQESREERLERQEALKQKHKEERIQRKEWNKKQDELRKKIEAGATTAQIFTPSPFEIDEIKKAVAERQNSEAAAIADRQRMEYQRTKKILDDDIAESLGHFDATQDAARNRFARDNAPPEGFDRVLDKIQRFLNPELARQRDAELAAERRRLEERLKKQRIEHGEALTKTRDGNLENLAERHAQQLRDHAAKTGEEVERYIKQEEDARRLRAEIEQRERELEEKRARDGPDPPERTR